jgi:hypothetical protein
MRAWNGQKTFLDDRMCIPLPGRSREATRRPTQPGRLSCPQDGPSVQKTTVQAPAGCHGVLCANRAPAAGDRRPDRSV